MDLGTGEGESGEPSYGVRFSDDVEYRDGSQDAGSRTPVQSSSSSAAGEPKRPPSGGSLGTPARKGEYGDGGGGEDDEGDDDDEDDNPLQDIFGAS